MSDSSPLATSSLPLSLSRRRSQAAEQSISFLMEQGLVNRDVISLAAGFVDEETLPVSLVQRAIEKIFSQSPSGQKALQYGSTGGNVDLQEQLVSHFARLERQEESSLGINLDQVVVTAAGLQEKPRPLSPTAVRLARPSLAPLLGEVRGCAVDRGGCSP